MGTKPVLIDASWFSAQHRARLFWGNVPGLGKTVTPDVNINLQDCLLPSMNRKALVEKIRTVTTSSNSLRQGKSDYMMYYQLVSSFNVFPALLYQSHKPQNQVYFRLKL
jgi:hypothetical protein